ncbi:MAG: hypothetical protein WDO16_19970 [Bacteroidota bacterium]
MAIVIINAVDRTHPYDACIVGVNAVGFPGNNDEDKAGRCAITTALRVTVLISSMPRGAATIAGLLLPFF